MPDNSLYTKLRSMTDRNWALLRDYVYMFKVYCDDRSTAFALARVYKAAHEPELIRELNQDELDIIGELLCASFNEIECQMLNDDRVGDLLGMEYTNDDILECDGLPKWPKEEEDG